ncbi:hypothetical protein O7607_29130 [Micromonospora sp. WMMA1949]|uniref:hypothetical protein n=1 Tax=unclassified Micromonospora TaxID=2617518 RepID=UPI0022B669B3|nr:MULTISPECIES: hypothetical protein [unclassified Micromonospora]MCZ7429833.1 hypothetical protein [Micromonospora sp. WMMA1949]WBC08681.1 hypothetical protein O7604_26165 [Micromonospora sp. WMMA1947]
MTGDQHVRRVRPYHWGAVYFRDADCEEEFDIDFHDGDGPVFATTHHVAVSVVHAAMADVGEADVTLDIRVRPGRVATHPYEATLDVPSGRLYVGDADGDDEIELAPGRWLLQFAVDDATEARNVELVMSPL